METEGPRGNQNLSIVILLQPPNLLLLKTNSNAKIIQALWIGERQTKF